MTTEAVHMGDDGRPRYVWGDLDRHGRPRWRFRRPGQRSITLPGPYKSDAFWAAYADALAGRNPVAACDRPKVEKVVPGSFRAACRTYFTTCTEFLRLDPETRRVRQRLFEAMWREPIRPDSPLKFADIPMREISAAHVRVLRDRKAVATPQQANHRIKALNKFFGWAVEEGIVRDSPMRDMRRIKVASSGHHVWTLDEVEAFEARHPLGSKARAALAMMLFTGIRISDAAQLGRQHIRDGWISLTIHKNRNRNPMQLEIPLLPDLSTVLEALPSGGLTYLLTEYGRQFSIKGLGQKFRDWCDAAGLTRCSAHGLRKAGATIAAERGATEQQLMAIFGWRDAKQAADYVRTANRKKLAGAAMHMLSRAQTENKILPQKPPPQARGSKAIKK